MNKYMLAALEQAKEGAKAGEIPVGAVVVRDGRIIAKAHNTVEKCGCTLFHAEVNAIEQASAVCGKFLDDCELYVTVEPCPMCTGAIINSRIKRLYIGAPEPESGCCGSKVDLVSGVLPRRVPEVYHGIMEAACKELMRDFFKRHRCEKYTEISKDVL